MYYLFISDVRYKSNTFYYIDADIGGMVLNLLFTFLFTFLQMAAERKSGKIVSGTMCLRKRIGPWNSSILKKYIQ